MVRRPLAIAVLFALVPLLAVSMAQASRAPQGVVGFPVQGADGRDRFVVVFRSGAAANEGLAAVRFRGGTVERVLSHVFPGAVATLPEQAVSALRRNPNVLVVERDHPVRSFVPPWGLDRVNQRSLPLDGVYGPRLSGAGVTIYVVDTGVNGTHVEFGGRVTPGFTAVLDGRDTADCNGHGTHVAGTAAGDSLGVAARASLVPVRVLGCQGAGTSSQVIAGIDWIIGHHQSGVPAVANLSLGATASASLDRAARALVEDGITVVVAAGNEGVDACETSPAREPVVVAVGASDELDRRATFSNFGACLDLFAPGVRIASAWIGSATATASSSGTSMAAPHVAGAAALLLEANPSLSAEQVGQRLVSTATTGAVGGSGAASPNRLLWVDDTATAPQGSPSPTPSPSPAPSGSPSPSSSPTPPPETTSSPTPSPAPKRPAGVKARAVGDRGLEVSWTGNGAGDTGTNGYRVQGRSVAGSTAPDLIATVPADHTSVRFNGVVPDVFYTFTVQATGPSGNSQNSAESDPVSAVRVLPSTTIGSGPRDGSVLVSSSATFAYSSSPPAASFRCRLDGSTRRCGMSSVRLTGLSAGTHALTVQAVDDDGDRDAAPPTTLFTVPRNNTALGHSTGWTQRSRSGSFKRSYSEAKRRGAALTTRVRGLRQLTLVAARGPQHGRVRVILGNRLLGSYGLAAPRLQKRRLISVATFDRPVRGRIRIVVVSTGRTVQIEGVATATR